MKFKDKYISSSFVSRRNDNIWSINARLIRITKLFLFITPEALKLDVQR